MPIHCTHYLRFITLNKLPSMTHKATDSRDKRVINVQKQANDRIRCGNLIFSLGSLHVPHFLSLLCNGLHHIQQPTLLLENSWAKMEAGRVPTRVSNQAI